MTQEELINAFKYIVKKCDMLINNGDYEADSYTQDTVEDIAELCNHILDGDYGKLVKVKEVQEDSISEEMEEASEKCIKELIPEAELNSAMPFALEYVVKLLHETFKAGAKWQKKQDKSIIELAEDHAMFAGMEKMKEEMMKKAVEGIARPDDNKIWCDLDSFNLKDGDKCRVIVIKKD